MTEKYFGQVFFHVGKWHVEGGKCFATAIVAINL